MKKLFTLLSFIIQFGAFSQVDVGGILGINSSNINNKDLVTTGRLTGFHFGVIADFKIKRSGFHIMAELLYSPGGYNNSNLTAVDNLGNNIGEIEYHRINYIQVPLYFSYGSQVNKTYISGGIGPCFALRSNDKLKIKGGNSFWNETVLPGGTQEMKDIQTGMGILLSARRKKVMVLLFFQQNFNSMYEMIPPAATKWKLNNVGLSAAWFFPAK